MPELLVILTLCATAFHGILAGASFDQSIKQLPARHRIGPAAYSTYSRASDLANGIAWYAMLGIGSAALTLAAALTALVLRTALGQAVPLYLAAVLSLLHSWVTTRAAPIMFSQRQLGADPAALTALFECFARWQALRAILQGCAFAALLWALTYARVM